MLQQKTILRRKRSSERYKTSQTLKLSDFSLKIANFLHKKNNIRVQCLIRGEQIQAVVQYCLMHIRKTPSSVKILVIAFSQDDAGEYEAAIRNNSRLAAKKLRTIVLPEAHPDRTQVQAVTNNPDILIGAPQQIIDHLRIGSLKLEKLQTVIVDNLDHPVSEIEKQDIEFILSKTSKKSHFCNFYGHENESGNFTKSRTGQIKALDEYRLFDSFFQLPLEDLSGLPSVLGRFEGAPMFYLLVSDSGKKEEAILTGLMQSHPDQIRKVLLNDFTGILVQENPVILIKNPPEGCGPFLEFLAEHQIQTIFFSMQERSVYKQFIKEHFMESKKIKLENEIEIKKKIQDILKKIRQTEDPFEMTEYKKIFKKHVPIFLRAYFAGYFIKYFLNNGKMTFSAPMQKERETPRETQRESKKENISFSNTVAVPSQTDAELTGDFQTLFVSVGKNRKVFPRDLSKLFCTEMDIKPTELGDINIFEKYSFINIPTAIAQQAIDKLNGQNYRGRKIVVNFARKKD